ncbi:uncharacterized protein LOC122947983 [Acropora millepora]|uniref:uncharacterized protein LOC122947983 n=1 Tax=Acropora millepora TaxID=45264 RepID=UPI001CF399D0|nr:uncharacterized protein LOC122947983 [Acropora millepora]
MHISWQKIAQLLQVSVSTLQRRRRAFGIDNQLEQFSDISDHDLDTIHRELTAADGNSSGGFLTPNIGRRRFMGALRNRGIRVQRWRMAHKGMEFLQGQDATMEWRISLLANSCWNKEV